MSYLIPNVVCSKVLIPETKKMVDIKSLIAKGFCEMHRGAASTNGMETVEPNIVK